MFDCLQQNDDARAELLQVIEESADNGPETEVQSAWMESLLEDRNAFISVHLDFMEDLQSEKFLGDLRKEIAGYCAN